MDAPTYGATPDANDRVSEIQYDLAGRTVLTRRRTATGPDDWAQTHYGYSRDGLVTSLTDAEGNVTDWDYASATPGLGRVQRMRYPSIGGIRQTIAIPSYDKNGNPLVIRHQAAESGTSAAVLWTNTFDERGRLKDRTASVESVPAGTEFLGTNYQRFDYDDLGRIVKATDRSPWSASEGPDIVTSNLFDTGGRLLMEDQQLPLGGSLLSHKVESTFLPDGFRSELRYPESYASTGPLLDRYTLTMTPDSLGRLQDVDGPEHPWEPAPGASRGSRELLRYAYLGGKVWTRTSGNGLEARYYEPSEGTNTPLYDHLGRLRGVRYVDTGAPTLPPLVDFRYGYDRVGNRTYEQRRHEATPGDTFRTRTYESDLLGRLAKWREGGLAKDSIASPAIPRDDPDPTNNVANPSDGESWALDQVGNWRSHSTGASQNPPAATFVPNALNQYTQVTPDGESPKPFAFDWLGQLRQDDSKDQRYVWDLFGRLTRVVRSSDSAEIARYRYDAFNRRVEKTTALAPDAITRYVYDGWRSIEERAVLVEATGPVERVRARYGFGIGLDEVVWMDRDVATGDIQQVEARYFLAQDALGSVVAATVDRATTVPPLVVAERYTYGAYGERSVWTGTWSAGSYTPAPDNASAIGLPFAFTGQRVDAESGLYYFKNRYVDAQSGRFLRRDPLGLIGGLNLYSYAEGVPTLQTDPLGLASSVSDFARINGWAAAQLTAENNRAFARAQFNNWLERNPYTPDTGTDATFDEWAVGLTAQNPDESLAIHGTHVTVWADGGMGLSMLDLAGPAAPDPISIPIGDLGVPGPPRMTANGRPSQSTIRQLPPSRGRWSWALGGLDLPVTVDQVQAGLDLIGLIPGVGEPFDIANGLISAGRGDYAGAGMSLGASIPGIGNILGGAKLLKRAARGVTRASDELVTIGRQVDTAVAKDWPGHRVLDIDDWTLGKNDAWVKGAIDQKAPVYLASPPTPANLFDDVAGRQTVFGREYQQFLDAGYTQQGAHLIPPP